MTEQNIPIPTNEEVWRRIVSDLLTIPDELLKSESFVGALREDLAHAEDELKDATLQAQINAPQTGKNAEARKLDTDAAVSASADVKSAKQKVIELETAISAREIDIKAMSRRFNAAMALAEFQAARINLSARIQKSPIPIKS